MSHFKLFALPLASAILFALLGCCVPSASSATENKRLLYVGTYTSAKSKGIYLFQMDLTDGSLTPLGVAAETPNPTFIDFDPKGNFLYVANEISKFNGQNAGAVSAFSVDNWTGKLTLLNRVSAVGSGTCHIVVDKAGKNVLVANYGSGSAAVLPIDADGMLRPASAFEQDEGKSVAPRQEKPHGHCVALDKANRFAFVCDLGTDKIMSYHYDAKTGTLTPNSRGDATQGLDLPFVSIKPGSGPRHLTFSRDGRFAYLISELASTVTVFAYDTKHGTMRELQTLSTLPPDFKGENICAEIVVSPNGRYVYASNRGDDSIAIFEVDARMGTLNPISFQPVGGRTPRHFTFDPSGKFVIVGAQDSNKLFVFACDKKTGFLIPTGKEAEVTAPVCLKFLPMP